MIVESARIRPSSQRQRRRLGVWTKLHHLGEGAAPRKLRAVIVPMPAHAMPILAIFCNESLEHGCHFPPRFAPHAMG